jgi:hypothetical protein
MNPRRRFALWRSPDQKVNRAPTVGARRAWLRPSSRQFRSTAARRSVKILQRQWLVCAIQEFHGREHEVGITGVFQIVNHEFAFGEGEVTCIPRLIAHLDRLPVSSMRSGAPRCVDSPEIILDVGMEGRRKRPM